MEGSGIVEKVGAGANFQVGEKVAYLGVGVHSYAGYTVVPANEVVKVPEGLSFEDAAAAMMQGSPLSKTKSYYALNVNCWVKKLYNHLKP
ncbi:hypothetical protein BC936DRAFT_145244, partial [Jimgerdemannia flammicorona]